MPSGAARRMQAELTRVREQTEPPAQLLRGLDTLEERLGARLDSLHDTIVQLEGEEPAGSWAVEKAKDVLAGNSD